MMNEKVKKVEVLRPEVQGSEDRGGSKFEGEDVLNDDWSREHQHKLHPADNYVSCYLRVRMLM